MYSFGDKIYTFVIPYQRLCVYTYTRDSGYFFVIPPKTSGDFFRSFVIYFYNKLN